MIQNNTTNNVTNNTTNITKNWVQDNSTNVVHSHSNTNSWYQDNRWQNRPTINSQNWNGRPWWHTPDYGSWHHGHWDRHTYYHGHDSWDYVDRGDNAWLGGLVAWGLGNMVYRTGYQVYVNPYVSRPVVIGATRIDYSRPIAVMRSPYELAYLNDQAKAQELHDRALEYFEVARTAFYFGDLNKAYQNINLAIALMPDDATLHEFRALVLFSAGKFSEAAEVMHAVLAVAPGWDWTTLSSLYRDQDQYTAELRQLEQYLKANPRQADARFLLAYHYITMGYPDSARRQLQAVLLLSPQDKLSADLIALLDEDQQKDFATQYGNMPAVDRQLLQGDWKAARPTGKIELELKDGNFTWDYDLIENDQKFHGRYAVDNALLIMATEDGSQMVGTVQMQDRDHFVYKLLGNNSSDPGLQFVRE